MKDPDPLTIAATGHRPEKLGGYAQEARVPVVAVALEYLLTTRPTRVIVGMAQGWDQCVARAAIAANTPFVAAVPFPGQHTVWPIEAQMEYEELLRKAAVVELVSNEKPKSYEHVARLLDERNRYMVDRADRIVALWDGSSGGTCNCLAYAAHRGIEVDNLWGKYEDVKRTAKQRANANG